MGRLTENEFKRISANLSLTSIQTLILTLTLTLKHKNLFGKTK